MEKGDDNEVKYTEDDVVAMLHEITEELNNLFVRINRIEAALSKRQALKKEILEKLSDSDTEEEKHE